MNFTLKLWYELSCGYNKIIDLDSNKTIPAKYVWDYSVPDSVAVPIYDSTGAIIKTKLIPLLPRRVIDLLYYTGILEYWYYDITQNVFYCKIRSVDIYINDNRNLTPNVYNPKKRFKVIFK